MNPIKTVLFPDTDICKDRLYPLLLFYAPIQVLQPVEPCPDDTEKAECDIFMEEHLCQGHTPVPIGKDRDRFLHLIRDIRERKDDYSAQLASLTVAAMSAPAASKGGELKHEIVSSLLAPHAVAHSSSDEETSLWQARLVLVISEILDRDEEELRQELAQIDEQEIKMFQSLQGTDLPDEENPFTELTRIRDQLEARRPQNEKHRFEAWLRLMGFSPPDHQPLFWLASSQDSGDQILNRFEKKHNGGIRPVFKLPLPAHIRISMEYLIEQVTAFRKTTEQLIAAITKELADLAMVEQYDPADKNTLLPGNRELLKAWQAALDHHFPASNHGRAAVTTYILPNSPVAELLSLNPSKSSLKNGLLGILKP